MAASIQVDYQAICHNHNIFENVFFFVIRMPPWNTIWNWGDVRKASWASNWCVNTLQSIITGLWSSIPNILNRLDDQIVESQSKHISRTSFFVFVGSVAIRKI